MDAKFYRRLISAAVASLVGTAALAASGGPEYSTMSISPGHGTSRAWISDDPIYARASQDLVGIEVVGSDGGSIGKIKAVVMGSDLQSDHAVISVVESPGTGATELLNPTARDCRLQLVIRRCHLSPWPGHSRDEFHSR